MLIPPRIITYPLCLAAETESNRWRYYDGDGSFGVIKVDFGDDKFNWTPTISYEKMRPVNEDMVFWLPLFRYDSSRKNMKPFFKWTKKQRESFTSPTNRPFDLIGIFTVIYNCGHLPVIYFNPWERKPWRNST